MALLAPLRIDPMPANVVAIAVCSLVNFAASERLVFKAARAAAGALLVVLAPVAAPAPIAARAGRRHDRRRS